MTHKGKLGSDDYAITGAKVKDRFTGETWEIKAKQVRSVLVVFGSHWFLWCSVNFWRREKLLGVENERMNLLRHEKTQNRSAFACRSVYNCS